MVALPGSATWIMILPSAFCWMQGSRSSFQCLKNTGNILAYCSTCKPKKFLFGMSILQISEVRNSSTLFSFTRMKLRPLFGSFFFQFLCSLFFFIILWFQWELLLKTICIDCRSNNTIRLIYLTNPHLKIILKIKMHLLALFELYSALDVSHKGLKRKLHFIPKIQFFDTLLRSMFLLIIYSLY